jgi:hypothetical protein
LVVTGTDERGVEAALSLLLRREDDTAGPVMVMAVQAGAGEIEVPAR